MLESMQGHCQLFAFMSLPPLVLQSRSLRIMSQLRAVVVTLFACLATVNAVALLTTPAAYLPNGYDGRSITVGPAPVITAAPELRRRQSSGVQTNCGESDGTTNYCLNGKACAATIYENGNAYGYCSSPGASTQAFETSALADVSSSYPYPKCPGIHVACWYVHPSI